MWPLFVCAIISVTVMIERSIALRRAAGDSEAFMEKIRGLLVSHRVDEALKLCDNTKGPIASIIASGIRNRHLDNASIERAMEELAMREAPLLQKRLGILDTVITLSPLLGLLGTITGMISAFNVVSVGGESAPTAITGGVAEALIATAGGLTVAIANLPVYNYLTEKVKEIIAEMEVSATQLLNILASLREMEGRPGDGEGISGAPIPSSRQDAAHLETARPLAAPAPSGATA
jgi:biopolymer transport protein ExbB